MNCNCNDAQALKAVRKWEICLYSQPNNFKAVKYISTDGSIEDFSVKENPTDAILHLAKRLEEGRSKYLLYCDSCKKKINCANLVMSFNLPNGFSYFCNNCVSLTKADEITSFIKSGASMKIVTDGVSDESKTQGS